MDPRVGDAAGVAAEFTARLDREELARNGIRLEDKGPIHAIHWRGAADLPATEARAAEIAADAAAAGLDVRRGRLVLELRPKVALDKGVAVSHLIQDAGATAALYAGDDRTDLDAFSDGEMGCLENHGYALADAAIRSRAPQLCPTSAPAFTWPRPDWSDDRVASAALQASGRRRMLRDVFRFLTGR